MIYDPYSLFPYMFNFVDILEQSCPKDMRIPDIFWEWMNGWIREFNITLMCANTELIGVEVINAVAGHRGSTTPVVAH